MFGDPRLRNLLGVSTSSSFPPLRDLPSSSHIKKQSALPSRVGSCATVAECALRGEDAGACARGGPAPERRGGPGSAHVQRREPRGGGQADEPVAQRHHCRRVSRRCNAPKLSEQRLCGCVALCSCRRGRRLRTGRWQWQQQRAPHVLGSHNMLAGGSETRLRWHCAVSALCSAARFADRLGDPVLGAQQGALRPCSAERQCAQQAC